MGNSTRTILNLSGLEWLKIQLSDIQVRTLFLAIVLLYFNALDQTEAALHARTHASRLGIHSIKNRLWGSKQQLTKNQNSKEIWLQKPLKCQ